MPSRDQVRTENALNSCLSLHRNAPCTERSKYAFASRKDEEHGIPHRNIGRRKRIRSATIYDVRLARLACIKSGLCWITMNTAWSESDSSANARNSHEVRYGASSHSEATVGGRRRSGSISRCA